MISQHHQPIILPLFLLTTNPMLIFISNNQLHHFLHPQLLHLLTLPIYLTIHQLIIKLHHIHIIINRLDQHTNNQHLHLIIYQLLIVIQNFIKIYPTVCKKSPH